MVVLLLGNLKRFMALEIKFYNLNGISEELLGIAVICAAYRGKWIFVKNKDRSTWEIPAGRREENESIDATASRELFEETGAAEYEIEPVCD